MYKTIRHGENSLQYTILPQHDDYSKGGGGGGGGVGGAGGGSTASNGRGQSAASLMPDTLVHGSSTKLGGVRMVVRKKQRSWMAYLGLFFVCSIITGAILVPLLVSVEVLSGPKDWFYRHTGHIGGSSSAAVHKATSVRLVASGVASKQETADRATANRSTESTTPPIIPLIDDALDKENDMEKNPPFLDTQSRLLAVLASPTPTMDASLSAEAIEPSIYIEEPIIPMSPTDEYATAIRAPVTTSASLDYPETTVQTTVRRTKLPSASSPTTLPNPGRKLRKFNTARPNHLFSVAAAPLPSVRAAMMANTDSAAGIGIAVVATPATSPARTWMDSHWPIVDSSTYFKWTVSGFSSLDMVYTRSEPPN